jgi:hypothetical protein
MAQGATKTASLNKAVLLHKSAAGVQETPLRLKSILKLESPDPILQAGDIIFVPTSSLKNAMGLGVPNILASAAGAAIYKF